MSAVEIILGATEPIGLRLRQGASVVTGATVRARVLRSSDNFELDWSTNTFVLAGTAVQPRQTLTEGPAGSGKYTYSWNTSTIVNPTTPDSYIVEFDQTAPTVRAFLRQLEVRVRGLNAIPGLVWEEQQAPHVPTIGSAAEALFAAGGGFTPTQIATQVWATLEGAPAVGTMGYAQVLGRRFITNRLYETPGNPGTIVLYADDAATPFLTWHLRDHLGASVHAMPGEPARREEAT